MVFKNYKIEDMPNVLPIEFATPDTYRVKAFKTVPFGLREFCLKYQRIVILSKLCKGLKLNFVKVGGAFIAERAKGRMCIFKDKEYLDYIGKYCEILVTWQDLLNILPKFGVGADKIKKAMTKNPSCFFDINDYANFVKDRKVKEKRNEIVNDAFVKDISIEPFMYYKKEYVSEHKYVADILKHYVNENTKNATDAEKAIQDVLIKNDIRCEFQKPCLVFGKCYIMDFYLPDYGICIEVDGDYHNTQEQLTKDRERSNRLAKTGILVVRFTNEEAMQRVEVRRFIDNVLKQEND